ncbi:hypothetical protein Tco_1335113 [Tanacetum coccineum]
MPRRPRKKRIKAQCESNSQINCHSPSKAETQDLEVVGEVLGGGFGSSGGRGGSSIGGVGSSTGRGGLSGGRGRFTGARGKKVEKVAMVEGVLPMQCMEEEEIRQTLEHEYLQDLIDQEEEQRNIAEIGRQEKLDEEALQQALEEEKIQEWTGSGTPSTAPRHNAFRFKNMTLESMVRNESPSVQGPDPLNNELQPTASTLNVGLPNQKKTCKRPRAEKEQPQMRIHVKNRGKSERIAKIQGKYYKFDAQGTGSTPDRAFCVST